MKKIILIITTFCSVIVARELTATKECEAFNNLKHTKNSMDITLEVGKQYEILRQQKGNYFIKIDNVNPKTRWVDIKCFDNQSENSTISSSNTEVKQDNSITNKLNSLLVVSWHNSFCETHSNKKECRRLGGEGKNHLVLHGLWPQPRNNTYCGVSEEIKKLDKMKQWSALPSLNLTEKTKNLMNIYMPGFKSNLQRHEWYKHGTCYSTDPNRYFQDALNMTKKLDDTIGEYLRANLGARVTQYNINKVAKRLITKDIDKKIIIKCKRAILSEIWVSIKGQGSDLATLVKYAKKLRPSCQDAIVDKAGKYRR